MSALLSSPLQLLLLALVPALPLVLAFILFAPRLRRFAITLAPWTALPALAAILLVQPGVELEVGWFFMGGRLGLDFVGQRFLLLTALIWLVAAWYAQGYLAGDERPHHFMFFYLLSMAFNFGLILAQDMLGFYLFFGLMSFSAYGLIIYRQTREAMQAGVVYIILVMLGEVLLFSGMVLLASRMPNMDLATVATTAPTTLSLSLILLGFAIKAGALPLHVWLPLAHPVAPVPASAVLSGVMIKAGLFGWLRFLPTGLDMSLPGWAGLFVVLGLIATFYGVVVGLGQQDVKTVLAYSSISQMGLMTMMVGCGLLVPRLWPIVMSAVSLYALHHGLAKTSLFLGVGVARRSTDMGLARVLLPGLLLASLALAGAPLTSGALAKLTFKDLIHELPGSWATSLGILLPLTSLATTVLLGHFLLLLHDAVRAKGSKVGMGMWVAWFLALVGLFVLPWLWAGQQGVGSGMLSMAGIWQGLWPIIGGGIAVYALRQKGRELFRLPAGDILWFFTGQTRMGMLWQSVLFLGQGEPPLELRNNRMPLQRLSALSRRLEKILKRWGVVGFCYLGLCLLILVLLRN